MSKLNRFVQSEQNLYIINSITTFKKSCISSLNNQFCNYCKQS
ncbi:hypothetical protein B0I21_11228 [Sphingobacterium paludis]|uniref:Uncharacterized protein n=1 Tax=Sphingobacterium paludis TaxID=1476465 RepID=A0A4R7CUV1_9SPHI|nr:hypothetical protein B0I21_11228 [Sphingobacterium paludis]